MRFPKIQFPFRKILRWMGRALLILVGIAAVAVGVVYAQSQRLISRKVPAPARKELAVAADSATLARGQTLMAANGCQGCHQPNLAGTVLFNEPMIGRLVTSNLTAGKGGVIAHYDNRALDAAIRDGVGWDGRRLAIMPANEFSMLADDDVAAIIAFLRSQKPVDNELQGMGYGPALRVALVIGKFGYPYDDIDHARVTVAAAPRGATVAQGLYLSTTCTTCHAKTFEGGPVHGSDKLAPNITPSARISQWSQAEFARVMREGVRPDGSKVDPAMPWQSYSKLSDDEIAGLYLYLKTIPARVKVTQP
jgi:mono/diheme cytochrome c family protein